MRDYVVEHPVALAELREDVVAQVVAHQVGVPVVQGEQPLEPIGRLVADVLGDLPAVAPLDRAEQIPYVITSVSPWLHPTEPSRDPREQVVELRRSLTGLDRYVFHTRNHESQFTDTRTTTGVPTPE